MVVGDVPAHDAGAAIATVSFASARPAEAYRLAARLDADWSDGEQASLARLAAREPALCTAAQQVARVVCDHGAVVLSGVPVDSDATVMALLMALGTPSSEGNGGTLVHEVAPKAVGHQRDLSEGRTAFPLHTDSTFLIEPHHFVALACCEAQPEAGGASSTLHVDALREYLSRRNELDVLAVLEEPAYPFLMRDPEHGDEVRQMPILAWMGDTWTVRYRGDAIAMGLRERPEALSQRHRDAVMALESALIHPELIATHRLVAGEIIFVDNRRTLHGRTAIGEGKRRRLRRLKAFGPAPLSLWA